LHDVPTFAESGLPNYDASSWNGISVPTGTPRAIVDKLNAQIVKIMRTPGTFDRLAADGTTPTGSTPEEFTAFIKAEQAKWGKVVREANIRVE
jgi:tripartite-type tricarboxylate transporter receptor subunit TctC